MGRMTLGLGWAILDAHTGENRLHSHVAHQVSLALEVDCAIGGPHPLRLARGEAAIIPAALSGKLSQAALKPDAENSCRCGGRGGPLGKSCRSEVAHCFPGSEVALDGEGVVDRGVG